MADTAVYSLIKAIMSSYFFILLVIVAGASVAFQQVLNANLRVQIGSPWWAAFVSYLVGLLFTLVIALVVPGPKFTETFHKVGDWLPWTGGLFGATFIAITILMVPKLGAATTISLVVVGQMLLSLTMDHFGWLGLPVQPVSLFRLIGAGLLILGVILIRA
ncbi:DMT family transporter [Herminiimonas sp. NPDC097707]|uniref:DMT family transporter n=1 Tax=Herminiimonas sp. NPDC097707 TaxID=3364007 RepID=UPI00383B49BF